MADDFDDDWELLRGPPRPQPPKVVIGYLVYQHEQKDVSPWFPIFHREGESEFFKHSWTPEQTVSIQEVVIVQGSEVIWRTDIARTVEPGITINIDLNVTGLRALFDQKQGKS